MISPVSQSLVGNIDMQSAAEKLHGPGVGSDLEYEEVKEVNGWGNTSSESIADDGQKQQQPNCAQSKKGSAQCNSYESYELSPQLAIQAANEQSMSCDLVMRKMIPVDHIEVLHFKAKVGAVEVKSYIPLHNHGSDLLDVT